MIRAKVTISQKVKIVRTVEVEAETYSDLYPEATSQFGFCLIDDYDDFDAMEQENIEILEEIDEEEEEE